MVFESLTLTLTLNLTLTSAISKQFSEDDFQRDLPLVDVGLRSPLKINYKFKLAKNIGNTDIRGYNITGYQANIRGYKAQITVIFFPQGREGGVVVNHCVLVTTGLAETN